MQFVTGYLLEWSLSVDNIFVIALIFAYLKIPTLYQYRVLFWGIVGAIVLRGLMIAAGTALLAHFDWMFYVFGAILLVSALRMLRNDDEDRDFGTSFPARLVRRFIPVTERARPRALLRAPRRAACYATPLFVALVMVELTDVVFAVDSIPAILAVTRDPFLVFTSNAFAILGLRSLYFAVAGLMAMFRYLKLQPGADPGLRRREDAAGQHLPRAEPGVARHHRRHAGRRHRRVARGRRAASSAASDR